MGHILNSLIYINIFTTAYLKLLDSSLMEVKLDSKDLEITHTDNGHIYTPTHRSTLFCYTIKLPLKDKLKRPFIRGAVKMGQEWDKYSSLT